MKDEPVAVAELESYETRNSVLADDLGALLNKRGRENASDTPDYILAAYLIACLEAFEGAVTARSRWYNGAVTAQPEEAK